MKARLRSESFPASAQIHPATGNASETWTIPAGTDRASQPCGNPHFCIVASDVNAAECARGVVPVWSG
jgi:hypothetical protein